MTGEQSGAGSTEGAQGVGSGGGAAHLGAASPSIAAAAAAWRSMPGSAWLRRGWMARRAAPTVPLAG